MIKEVVYITNFPWTNRDNKRLGVEHLEKNGRFKVTLFDVTAVLVSHMNYGEIVDQHKSERIRYFRSKKDIAKAIAQLDRKVTFVFIFLGEDPRRNFIYRLLSQYSIRHGLLTTNVLPRPPIKVGNLLSKISDPNRVCSFLKVKVKNNCNRIDQWIRPLRGVDLWVTTNEQDMKRYPFPRDERSEVLFGHALDYDLCLQNGVNKKALNDKTVIFLDQCIPYHPDFTRFGVDHYVQAENYYPSLHRFFNCLEEKLGCCVKIAVHPHSQSLRHSDGFQGYPTFTGETCHLVADSSCVVAHCTMATNFAVLYRKPILFVTTKELQASPLQGYIETLSNLLGKNPINVDEPLTRINWDFEMTVNEEKYNAYKARFIKMPGTPELPLWEIVARRLKQYV